jgi:DNA invertase Pin-like site-specific DNA recombinase
MRTALYARVSTNDKGQDVSMQIREFHEFCARRQWEVIDEYVDHGVSGSKDSRPELNRMMADAKRRKFDAVVVYRFDRFARSTRHLVNALAEFSALGIQFISMHEGIDTSTPNGRLVFGIFASIAEFERDLIRERVRSGIANRKAKGLRIGRKPVAIDPIAVTRLQAQGRSIRQIAAELGCSRSLVHRTVQTVSKTPQNLVA